MSTVHVVPANDLIQHEIDGEDCPCGPLIEPVPRADGTMGWIASHHALDNRENRES